MHRLDGPGSAELHRPQRRANGLSRAAGPSHTQLKARRPEKGPMHRAMSSAPGATDTRLPVPPSDTILPCFMPPRLAGSLLRRPPIAAKGLISLHWALRLALLATLAFVLYRALRITQATTSYHESPIPNLQSPILWLAFVIALLPVINLLPLEIGGGAFVCERFVYLPSFFFLYYF